MANPPRAIFARQRSRTVVLATLVGGLLVLIGGRMLTTNRLPLNATWWAGRSTLNLPEGQAAL